MSDDRKYTPGPWLRDGKMELKAKSISAEIAADMPERGGLEMSDDPFGQGLFGGLPKMVIAPSSRFMSGTTVPTNTKTDGNEAYSQALAKRSSSERQNRRPRLYGASSSMTAGKPASTVPSSETKVRTYRASLSDRLTPSLISAGLVNGITPTSTRQVSGQAIRVFAFLRQAGGGAE